jgi:CDP-diacylglycerol--glycerol-3-phosphate 3-phosphatidyltransferase
MVVIPKNSFTSFRKNDGEEDEHSGNDPKVLLTIPNAITMARIAASPGISYLIFTGSWNEALAGFSYFILLFLHCLRCLFVKKGLCIAGASDWLDGYIARNYNQMSALGSILDPLADKILVGAVALPLAISGHLPMWLVGLTLARDLGLCVGFVWLRSYGVPTPRKKIKHVIQQGMEEIYTPASELSQDGDRERIIEVLPSKLSKVGGGLCVIINHNFVR